MELTDQIRNAASIVEIASQYTTLKRRGRKYVGLCPFHSEKDPSFTLDEDKQLFHCFGCGVGGDIFTLVMEKENLSFPEALRFLAQKYNIPLPEKRKISPRLQKQSEQLYEINETALAFFRKNLFNTSEGRRALDYLLKRNISEETIQKLKIGYAMNSWTALYDFFTEKGVSSSLLEKAGLVIPSSKKDGCYDRFRGRIIFPIFTVSGKVVAFGGRTVFEAEPKYLNSPETPLYTKGELLYGLNFTRAEVREKGQLIIVEGYTDFVSLFQAGIKNIAASLGTSLTPAQVSIASRFAPEIIVNYDSDSAGRMASARAVSICLEKGVQVRVANLPENHDPDTYIQKHGSTPYRELLVRSTPGFRMFIDSLVSNGRMDVPEEKSRVVKKVVEELEKIPDSVARSEYLRLASEYLRVDEEIMRQLIRKKSRREEESEEGEFLLPAEKRLLQILLEEKEISSLVLAEMKEEDFEGLRSEPVFKILFDSYRNERLVDEHELNQKIEPRLRNLLSLIRLEKKDSPNLREALDDLFALRKKSLEDRMKKIQAEIARIEKSGESEKLALLLQEKHDIVKQILSL
ncbi:MAG: DNA primase [Candidatus Aminicenantales bacterium]